MVQRRYIITKDVWLDGLYEEPTTFYLNERGNWCFAHYDRDAKLYSFDKEFTSAYMEAAKQTEDLCRRDKVARHCRFTRIMVADTHAEAA